MNVIALPSSSRQDYSISPTSCAVCGKFAKGNHHGALSCRGCSAFFRRAAGIPNYWKCKNGDGKCDIIETNEPQCKKCRLDKCYSVGMSPRNFQFDRDSIIADDRPMSLKQKEKIVRMINKMTKVAPSIEIYLGRPHIFIRCEPDLASQKKVYLDLHSLINRASEMLHTGETKEFDNRSSLENLSSGLAAMRIGKHSNGTKARPSVLKHIGKNEMMIMWEYDFLRTTKWLTNFKEFQKLPHSLKLDLVKTIWHVWGYLERLAITAEKRRLGECGAKEIMVNNEIKLDMMNFNFDIAWCTNYSQDQLSFFVKGPEKAYPDQIIDLFIETNPTNVELNFILIQICFTYAGRFHQGDILSAMERLEDVVSNEIHEYYVNELKMTNYAGRLTKLLKADKLMQLYLREKKKKIEVARLFDIFKIIYSHPEMFQDTAFC